MAKKLQLSDEFATLIKDKLTGQITVVGSDMSITTTADQVSTNLKLDTLIASVGDKLTLDTNTNSIKIGDGVSYVSVSCGCCIIHNSSGMTYHALRLTKNFSSISNLKWAQTKGQYSPSTYGYTTLSDILIPVKKGDTIQMSVFNRIAGTFTAGQMYMSVRVVK